MSTPSGRKIAPRKLKYEKTLLSCLNDFKKMLIIKVDNVGSKQMSDTRHQLRNKAQILMGKNTVIRRILERESVLNPSLKALKEQIRGNIGFCFTNGDLIEIRDKLTEKKDPALAKAGTVAPADVWIEPMTTGLDPGNTGFFQALNIPTKINRGAIEITARVQMCVEGEKVSASASTLLARLGMKPFAYGIQVLHVFEGGSCYSAKVLDLSEEDIMKKFMGGLVQASCLSLGIGYPSIVSIPHLLGGALRKLIAFSVETSYEIEAAEPFKAFLADPSAFAVATGTGDGAGEAKKEEKKAEEEEEDDDGGFDFDDDEE